MKGAKVFTRRRLIVLALAALPLVCGASAFGADGVAAKRFAKSSPIRQTSYSKSGAGQREARSFSAETAPGKLPSSGSRAKRRPEDACLRIVWERQDSHASRQVSFATACYIKLFNEYFLISAMHGIEDDQSKILAELWQLTFTTVQNERFAFDYGDGSVALRQYHEKKGHVAKVDSYVKLKSDPLLIEDHDVVVFRLNGPLHGIAPLLPKPSDVKIGDSVSALVANYRQVGLVRNCKISEVDRKYGQGVSSLCFVSKSFDDKLAQGNSGAVVVTDDLYVTAILIQIMNTGVYELSDGFALLTSETGLAVKMDLLIPTIRDHWGLDGAANVATRLDSRSTVAAR